MSTEDKHIKELREAARLADRLLLRNYDDLSTSEKALILMRSRILMLEVVDLHYNKLNTLCDEIIKVMEEHDEPVECDASTIYEKGYILFDLFTRMLDTLDKEVIETSKEKIEAKNKCIALNKEIEKLKELLADHEAPNEDQEVAIQNAIRAASSDIIFRTSKRSELQVDAQCLAREVNRQSTVIDRLKDARRMPVLQSHV